MGINDTPIKSSRLDLYGAIRRERKYQLEKYPPDSEYPRTIYGYLAVAEAEVDEAILAYCKHIGDEEARRELLQVVATGCAWLESMKGENSWGPLGLEELYRDSYSTIRWLQKIKGTFEQCRAHQLDDPDDIEALQVALHKITAMGMRCLMLHGVVEREIIQLYEDAKAMADGAEPRGFFKVPFAPITDEQAEAFVQALNRKREEDQQPPAIEFSITQRGFALVEFSDLSRIECSLQESSLATDDAIWFGVNSEQSQPQPESYKPTRMHLNKVQVAALLPYLQYFAEHGSLPPGKPVNDND